MECIIVLSLMVWPAVPVPSKVTLSFGDRCVRKVGSCWVASSGIRTSLNYEVRVDLQGSPKASFKSFGICPFEHLI